MSGEDANGGSTGSFTADAGAEAENGEKVLEITAATDWARRDASSSSSGMQDDLKEMIRSILNEEVSSIVGAASRSSEAAASSPGDSRGLTDPWWREPKNDRENTSATLAAPRQQMNDDANVKGKSLLDRDRWWESQQETRHQFQ